MSMEATSEEPEAIVRRILAEASPDAVYYFVDPSWDYVFALSLVSGEIDELPEIRLLAERGTLLNLRQRFPAGSRAANLIESGRLAVREREPSQDTPLIVGEGRVHAPLLLDDVATQFTGDSGSFTDHATEVCAAEWEAATEFSLRTPALERVTTTMDADLGESFRTDFEASLSRATAQRDTGGFEEVLAALVVGAKNGTLHYDLSKWGEDIRLASKATFSRRKGELEELGVLTTERVPVEMGRPRQRLTLTEEYAAVLEEHGVDELVSRIAA
jgi:hypothetical protein